MPTIEKLNHTNSMYNEIVARFPPGARVEWQGGMIYIYDETRTKRWSVHDFSDWEDKRHMTLSLQGETSGGTWHDLMESYQVRNATTGEILNTGITVDVITGDWGPDHTPNREIIYCTSENGRLSQGAGGGYNGPRSRIEFDLDQMHALEKTIDDLPHQIDVLATLERLTDTFWRGEFVPPNFVVPAKKTMLQALRGSLHPASKRLIG
jgi:hypothetical protein